MTWEELLYYDKAQKFDELRRLIEELRVHRDLGRDRLAEITLRKIYEIVGVRP